MSQSQERIKNASHHETIIFTDNLLLAVFVLSPVHILLSIFWKREYLFIVWNRSKSKLCKFYIIDKFVKNICKYLSETDHLLEYWNCIHNNARAAAREIFNFATIIKHLLENA